MRAGRRIVRALLEKSGKETGMCSVIFCPLFSSSPLPFISLLLLSDFFFVTINNRQFGVGPDRTDKVGDRNARGTRRERGNGYVSCYFLFSTLLISSSHFSSFSNCLQCDNRRVGAGRNGTDAGGAATWDGTGGQAGGKGR